ncbi:hypothetical protein ACFL27_20230 [candidate division CSSED10-310 bacterium]|uniref:Glycosyltransferase RgtA/B/C/D-like domain-containing protein n=1 Tax=candidate division CSSED10-310 bacterium TaxID=2855610 RepID=A0ABV6Z245_UNCC1
MEAFSYFGDNLWPPDLNADGLYYTVYGWSRVYSGEIVYNIYGLIGKVITLFWKPVDGIYLIYRYLNVCLFLITLIVLFFVRCRWLDPASIGLTFILLPQVHYLYAYASCDPWSLSMSVFLFLYIAKLVDAPICSLTLDKYMVIGIFTGLIIVSKPYYLCSLFIPLSLFSIRLVEEIKCGSVLPVKKLIINLTVTALTMIIVAGPLRLIYPATQGDFVAGIKHMMESRAADEYKPSHPTFEGYLLASKGETYHSMLKKFPWISLTLKSFYGIFGHMQFHNPPWIYWSAGIGFSILLCLTIKTAISNWSRLDGTWRYCFILALISLGANIFISLYMSLHFDYQPQGRYLFPSLIAVSILLNGLFNLEKRAVAYIRIICIILLYVICLYSLLYVAGNINPRLLPRIEVMLKS